MEIQLRTCVSGRKDAAWSIGRQLFLRKPEGRAASSLRIHTAAQRDTVRRRRSSCDEANGSEPQHKALEFVPALWKQHFCLSCNRCYLQHKVLKVTVQVKVQVDAAARIRRFGSHLDDRMSCGWSLDGSSAPLCLIVGSVVRAGLHLDTQLVLVKLGRQRPVEWRQGVRPTSVERQKNIRQ